MLKIKCSVPFATAVTATGLVPPSAIAPAPAPKPLEAAFERLAISADVSLPVVPWGSGAAAAPAPAPAACAAMEEGEERMVGASTDGTALRPSSPTTYYYTRFLLHIF